MSGWSLHVRLLLEPGFDRRGAPACGMLWLDGAQCPADGTETEEIADLGEAAVEAALGQDADVITVRNFPDLGTWQGIGALLRF